MQSGQETHRKKAKKTDIIVASAASGLLSATHSAKDWHAIYADGASDFLDVQTKGTKQTSVIGCLQKGVSVSQRVRRQRRHMSHTLETLSQHCTEPELQVD
jgi:hypothetical protein